MLWKYKRMQHRIRRCCHSKGFKASRLPLTFSEGKPYERKVMQPERLSIPPEGMLGQMQGLFFYCTPPFGGAIKEK
jgi:hypothetical protein